MTKENGATRKDRVAFVISLWLIPVIFHIIYWLADGAVWCADSISYVTMYDSREPLYPVILALFRSIRGVYESLPMEAQPYLFWVAGMQSLLAGLSVGSLVSYLVRRLHIGMITGYALMMIPIGVSLLNRYAARRGSMYSNCILTEGITVSIYLIFIRYLYEYICTASRRACICASILALAGILARKQMYICLILLAAAGIYVCIRERRQIVFTVVMAVSVLVLSILADCTYNYVLRGTFIRHTEDNRFVSTMALYTAEREYAEYLDPGIRDIYLEIYDTCDEAGYLYHDAPSGWMDAVAHFEDNYDHIQLDVMEVVLERRADDAEYAPAQSAKSHSARMDAVRSAINSSLLPHEVGRLFRVILYNILSGLVLTVARMNTALTAYSVLIYAAYIALTVMLIRRLRGAGHPTEGCADVVRLAVLIAAAVAVNVALVSVVIFCQTRYMIYNMPLFYMAILILGVDYGKLRNRSR